MHGCVVLSRRGRTPSFLLQDPNQYQSICESTGTTYVKARSHLEIPYLIRVPLKSRRFGGSAVFLVCFWLQRVDDGSAPNQDDGDDVFCVSAIEKGNYRYYEFEIHTFIAHTTGRTGTVLTNPLLCYHPNKWQNGIPQCYAILQEWSKRMLSNLSTWKFNHAVQFLCVCCQTYRDEL